MYTLGIETSCDETAASVVCDGRTISSSVTASSLRLHSRYGGIIPEIASRAQLEYINAVVDCALKKAHIALGDVDLIAVTRGPGLIGSLLVGISFAKALSYARRIALIGVDHVQAHLYAAFLDGQSSVPVRFPFIGLVVSGGHTRLYYYKRFDTFRVLGDTLDDAAGEAFDKVAKLLGLGYPGGPAIERCATRGNPEAYRFSCGDPRRSEFSFSGIKTAVLYAVREIKKRNAISLQQKRDLAASFQASVVSCLVQKTINATVRKKARTLVVGGGVVANKSFRRELLQKSREFGINVLIPRFELCTDNASMVAGLGYQLHCLGKRDSLHFKPRLY